MVNLYYNRYYNVDFSEHEIFSCGGEGDTAKCNNEGKPWGPLCYIRDHGVVNENCFPNPINCDHITGCWNKCLNPSERIQSSDVIQNVWNTEDDIKKLVIKAPMTLGLSYLKHYVVLSGYHKVQAGDYIEYIINHIRYKFYVPEGDPLIGKTYWICKNSGGPSGPNGGYSYYVFDDLLDINHMACDYVVVPITSLTHTDNDIRCVDLDDDGIYNWGIGTKPATCPFCPDFEDGDDSDPYKGPIDENGNYTNFCDPVIINSNTTWTSNQNPCGYIIINSGTLTINSSCTVNMGDYSFIKINSGGSLVISGGSILNTSITAFSGSSITLQNNGKIKISKGGILNLMTGSTLNNVYGQMLITP